MKIHTGDMVVIISGKEKGKTGRVLRVLSLSNRIVIAGANMRTKFVKRTQSQPGRRLHFEGSMDASNVMIIDPATGKRSRVGYRVGDAQDKDSKTPRSQDSKEARARKERFSKESGKALLSGKKLRKLLEEEQVGKEGKEGKVRKEGKGGALRQAQGKEEKIAAPKRSAFWERLGFGKGRGEEDEGGERGGGEVRRHDQSTRKAPSGER